MIAKKREKGELKEKKKNLQVELILKIFGRIIHYKSFFIFNLLIIVTIIFAFLSPQMAFIKQENLITMLRLTPEFGIVTLGMALLLISGEFDLSVGSIFALGSLVAAWTYTNWGWDPIVSLIAALIVGALCGFINGAIIVKSNVSSLIVTLGMMWVYRGLLLLITGGFPVYFHPEHKYPLFYEVFAGFIGPIPIQMVWMIGITVILYILLEHTKFGNWILATGSNKDSARMMGINTNRVKTICFMILGLLSALAGVMQSCRIHGAYGVQGEMLNLRAIAAAVVGGTSIFGGVGTIPGAMFGSLIIQFLDSGFLAIGLSMFHFYIALGSTLIIVVFVNLLLRKVRLPT